MPPKIVKFCVTGQLGDRHHRIDVGRQVEAGRGDGEGPGAG